MSTQLHDLADPLQQCGHCAGWARDALWCRIRLVGDEDGGVAMRCEECGYAPLVLAYLGHCPPDRVTQVWSVADLIAVGEQHVVSVHG